MRANILCKLIALGLATALCGNAVSAGAMVQKAPVATSGVVLVAQKRGKAPRGRRGGITQQQIMQGAKKYLPPEYQQYLGGQGGGMGGAGGMGGMGGMGGGGMGR